MTRLFVYGTLQHPPLLEQLLGRLPSMRPARLAGWRAAPLAGQVYPGLVADPGSHAEGQVIDVDADELALLDRFEGPMYERISVDVDSQGTAEAWRLRADSGFVAQPGSWDLQTFVEDHAEHF